MTCEQLEERRGFDSKESEAQRQNTMHGCLIEGVRVGTQTATKFLRGGKRLASGCGETACNRRLLYRPSPGVHAGRVNPTRPKSLERVMKARAQVVNNKLRNCRAKRRHRNDTTCFAGAQCI